MDQQYQTSSPVLFLVFNRPHTTEKVFRAIREARPSRLYVAADGPREDRDGEAELSQETRRVATNVDWNCQVNTLFRTSNLGCKRAVSSGIDWFFEHEAEGIILEDDCLPSMSFFRFCDELLSYYRGDSRVGMISGHNKKQRWRCSEADYFFSHFGGIWGWATWRRAWANMDVELTRLNDAVRAKSLRHLLGWQRGRAREETLLHAIDHVDTWDYQWTFARNIGNQISCVPCTSLIENIGFGADATHTTTQSTRGGTAEELSFPLRHNTIMVADSEYDELFVPVSAPPVEALRRLKRRVRRCCAKSAW